MTSRREHLHHLDHPRTLRIPARLLDHRDRPPAGYERTDHGVWVDWESLAHSYLSSSEVAVVHVARACAIAERHGGVAPSAAATVRRAIEELTGGLHG